MTNYKNITLYSSLLTLLPVTAAYADGKYDMQNHLAGVYGGLHAGQAKTGMSWTEVDDDVGFDFTGPGEGPDQDLDGQVWGGHVGFNWVRKKAVFGVEASISDPDLKQSGTLANLPGLVGVSQNDINNTIYTTEIDRLITITGKAGTKIGKNAVGYVKGGYAGGRVKLSIDHTNVNNGFQNSVSSSPQWHNGLTVGVGAEVVVNKNVSVGIEYNHIELEDKLETLNGYRAATGRTIATTQDVKPESMDTLMARVNFNFH